MVWRSQTVSEKRRYPADTVLVLEGDLGRDLFILIDGQVEVSKGGLRISVIEKKGSFFGEMSTLLGVARTATLRTLTPCVLYLVPEEEVDQLFKQSPDLGVRMARELAERLQDLTGRFFAQERDLTQELRLADTRNALLLEQLNRLGSKLAPKLNLVPREVLAQLSAQREAFGELEQDAARVLRRLLGGTVSAPLVDGGKVGDLLPPALRARRLAVGPEPLPTLHAPRRSPAPMGAEGRLAELTASQVSRRLLGVYRRRLGEYFHLRELAAELRAPLDEVFAAVQFLIDLDLATDGPGDGFFLPGEDGELFRAIERWVATHPEES